MNRKLSDEQIATTFEALRSSGARVSGRALRAALRARFGSTGKTERVFAHCRALSAPVAPTGLAPAPATAQVTQVAQVAQWRAQLLAAEQATRAAQAQLEHALARAERSEAREVAHQDRWASEVHALRESVAQLKGERARRQLLEDQVLRLQRELQTLRQTLARHQG